MMEDERGGEKKNLITGSFTFDDNDETGYNGRSTRVTIFTSMNGMMNIWVSRE